MADQLPGALAQEERRNSTEVIAEMMQVFLASDVLLISRFEPHSSSALKKEDMDAMITSRERFASCRTSSG